MKKKKISFRELIEENKVELMNDKKHLEEIEERLEAKRLVKVEQTENAS